MLKSLLRSSFIRNYNSKKKLEGKPSGYRDLFFGKSKIAPLISYSVNDSFRELRSVLM